MKNFTKAACMVAVAVSSFALALPNHSVLTTVHGLKFPNSIWEGDEPIATEAYAPATNALTGFSELAAYVLRSPDQEDAGTCLYMTVTGLAEWWLARLNPQLSREVNGPLDLSERYLINFASSDHGEDTVKNWRTDTPYLWNVKRKAMFNKDYRFTKGWFLENDDDIVPAAPDTTDAIYGVRFNWINGLTPELVPNVALPYFERTILYKDIDNDQWAVGVMSNEIIEKVKKVLLTEKAPVHVLYNHMGYWHSVFLVGYDDNMDMTGCPFVEASRKHFSDTVAKLRLAIKQTTDSGLLQILNYRLNKAQTASEKLEAAYKNGGGCSGKGAFYVRDSIYEDPEGPKYDYDLSTTGDEAPYAKPIIVHEYDWLKYLGNHAMQVVARNSP